MDQYLKNMFRPIVYISKLRTSGCTISFLKNSIKSWVFSPGFVVRGLLVPRVLYEWKIFILYRNISHAPSIQLKIALFIIWKKYSLGITAFSWTYIRFWEGSQKIIVKKPFRRFCPQTNQILVLFSTTRICSTYRFYRFEYFEKSI